MKNLFLAVAFLCSVSAFGQSQFQNETANFLTTASDKIMQLAEAVPEDKYDWSPQEGVRSFSGVLHHVVSANYFFATKMGAELPEGVNMETLKDDLSTKEDYAAALKQSFEVVQEALKNADEASLSEKVEFPFPGEYTGMSTALILLSHANEHLGQLIGYTRMNGITPPWSEGQASN
ncbi:DinB family protein [Tunicatimonas pelagia]|uniref:DinB family protein n=1 Tax=Tunicatimonas pelagia TaxID=931531 RepID=UPI00266579A0|nr:DinB family protein [Tunicatimonas pelagia]WKN42367.1 DinB family protein [Tunicatimonas pelagia]